MVGRVNIMVGFLLLGTRPPDPAPQGIASKTMREASEVFTGIIATLLAFRARF